MSISGPEPIRQQSAFLYAGKRAQAGTVLLFPDRIVHVASNAMQIGVFGGALGAVLAQQAAKKRALGRATDGGQGVIEIELDLVGSIQRGKQGLNRNVLEITTVDGNTYKFGVKYDKWAPDLARLVPSSVLLPLTAGR